MEVVVQNILWSLVQEDWFIGFRYQNLHTPKSAHSINVVSVGGLDVEHPSLEGDLRRSLRAGGKSYFSLYGVMGLTTSLGLTGDGRSSFFQRQFKQFQHMFPRHKCSCVLGGDGIFKTYALENKLLFPHTRGNVSYIKAAPQ